MVQPPPDSIGRRLTCIPACDHFSKSGIVLHTGLQLMFTRMCPRKVCGILTASAGAGVSAWRTPLPSWRRTAPITGPMATRPWTSWRRMESAGSIYAVMVLSFQRAHSSSSEVAERTVLHPLHRSKISIGKTAPWWDESFWSAPPTKLFKMSLEK